MNTVNEWGLSQAPTTAAPSAVTPTLIGAGIGAVIGFVGADLLKKPLWGKEAGVVGGIVGAVVGGVGGYLVGKPTAAAAPAPTPTTILPPGQYTLLPAASSLQPGGTYLLSRDTAGIGNLAAALQQVVTEIQSNCAPSGSGSSASCMTVLGSWIGLPPSGWPSNDPNAAAGIFLAIKNTTTAVATNTSGLTVFATGGASV